MTFYTTAYLFDAAAERPILRQYMGLARGLFAHVSMVSGFPFEKFNTAVAELFRCDYAGTRLDGIALLKRPITFGAWIALACNIYIHKTQRKSDICLQYGSRAVNLHVEKSPELFDGAIKAMVMWPMYMIKSAPLLSLGSQP